MKENIEFLNYIYKSAKMSLVEIDEIKPSIKDKKILTLLKNQEEVYFTICTKATEQLLNLKTEPEDISSLSRVMTFIDTRISTMNDSSNSNIAKTLITSTNKNIIELQQQINKYHGKTPKVLKLANDLLRAKQRNLESLKKYL